MNFSLANKTALITGASGDIGRAIATAYAQAGANIVVSGNTQAKIDSVVREVSAHSTRVIGLRADLRDSAACKALAAEAIAQMGRVDILVNCGGMNRRKPILNVTEDDYEKIMDVHVRGSYFLSQAIAPHMIENRGGKIIHIGSASIRAGIADISVYGMAKAGLDALTRMQAVEWAEHNIQVNCLAPGFIMTDLTRDGVWGNEKRSAWLLSRIPMRRAGTPEELTGVAVLLASAASAYLTGQTIHIDGGFSAGSSWNA